MTESVYLRPSSLAEALAFLDSGNLTIAAGCTDLFPATERKRLAGSVLDVTSVAEMRGIRSLDAGLRIGAATTWTEIVQADLPSALDGLKLAAREVGARQIQNRGTIGGNLCNASPAADGVPTLLTLEAEVELASVNGSRRLALSEFLRGPRRTALASGELLVAIHIPQRALVGQGAFLKLGAREYLVISIAMTAARVVIDQGHISDIALAVGSCGPVATRLPALEAKLIGKPVDPALITPEMVSPHIAPIDDMRADAGYRHCAAVELVRRVLSMSAHFDKAVA